MVRERFGQYGAKKEEDSINENGGDTHAQYNQCLRVVVLVGGDSLEGETRPPSLEITSSHRLLGRNIKIHLDITQVFYHALSDPVLPYHALHTLKHGYLFLDTLLTFKYKEGPHFLQDGRALVEATGSLII